MLSQEVALVVIVSVHCRCILCVHVVIALTVSTRRPNLYLQGTLINELRPVSSFITLKRPLLGQILVERVLRLADLGLRDDELGQLLAVRALLLDANFLLVGCLHSSSRLRALNVFLELALARLLDDLEEGRRGRHVHLDV